jgi:hypothetical protein
MRKLNLRNTIKHGLIAMTMIFAMTIHAQNTNPDATNGGIAKQADAALGDVTTSA